MALDEDRFFQEMRAAMERGFVVPVAMDLPVALSLVGALQLALRHRGSEGTVAINARTVIDGIIRFVEEAGYLATAELMRMGYNTAYDTVPGGGESNSSNIVS